MNNFFSAFRITTLIISITVLNQSIATLNGRAITCNSINELKRHISPQCLIVADFDNTLFECVDQNKGSDQWFCQGINHLKHAADLDQNEALNKMISIYAQVHETALIKPVESSTIPVIEWIKKKSDVTFLVLTARSIINQTKRELKQLKHSPISNYSFAPFHRAKSSLTFNLPADKAYYDQGIFYCGHNNKGTALIELMNKLRLSPKKIIFIDDKESNVLAVEAAIKNTGIPFVGLRYAFLDKKIEKFRFDPESLFLTNKEEQIRSRHDVAKSLNANHKFNQNVSIV